VRFAKWRKFKQMSQVEAADALGVSQPMISMIERNRDAQIPRRDLMIKIYRLTKGEVTPNDFYELPSLEQLDLNIGQPQPAPLFEGAVTQ